MKKILVKETTSTNSFLLDSLKIDANIEEGTIFYTPRQTAGRGQIGNKWESEYGKNITFSILLQPTFLPIREQFLISEITCLAIVDTLQPLLPSQKYKVAIKWPNDIYINNDKVCGILIENTLMGSEIITSVIGAGINVNQTQWFGDAPNPTSLKLCTGKDFSTDIILDKVAKNLLEYYKELKSEGKDKIHKKYLDNIYRRDGIYRYKDAKTDEFFDAKIETIEPSGYLVLKDTDDLIRSYMFKEVKFVLPCGVTKE